MLQVSLRKGFNKTRSLRKGCCMLMRSQVCWRMLTYADVCRRTLTQRFLDADAEQEQTDADAEAPGAKKEGLRDGTLFQKGRCFFSEKEGAAPSSKTEAHAPFALPLDMDFNSIGDHEACKKDVAFRPIHIATAANIDSPHLEVTSVRAGRCSIYFLYWYKSTGPDTCGAASV